MALPSRFLGALGKTPEIKITGLSKIKRKFGMFFFNLASGLSLYMARGTKLEEYVSDVNNGEEGEIAFVENSKHEMEYDVGKLIAWPGFNVQPDKDYKEEHRLYRAPSLQLDSTTPKFESLDTICLLYTSDAADE